MPLYEFEGRRPTVGRTSYINETAVVIGDVRIGETCFIGAGAVLRADWGTIIIGNGSNVQENAVVHAGPESTTTLGPNSHVGHGAILHGCVLDEHVMVGMGAIINDASHIGANCVIASGALVAPRTTIPPSKLVVGVPARVVRDTGEQMEEFTWMGTQLYQTLPERYRSSLRQVSFEECAPSD